MKKLILSLSLLVIYTVINAQSVKLQSAISYNKNNRLDKAKENIDAATIHEKTMNESKTWSYRGRIYVKIASTTNPEYQKLEPNALQIAYDAFQKSIEMDTEKEFEQDNMIGLFSCSDQYYMKGVESFNKKEFKDAIDFFEKTVKINTAYGRKDTSAIFNAALCAELGGFKAKAKEHFNSLVALNYDQPSIYSSLANIYKAENDTIKAVKIIEKGRKRFPDNFDLIIAEANIFLYTGNAVKAQNALNAAVLKDPNNHTIHFAVGTNYEKMGDIVNAEISYLKAIEIKSDFFDAIYNLGALHVNNAVSILEKANALPLGDKGYDVLKKQSEEQLNKAMPYLEKASEMQPKDAVVLTTLKDIYIRLNLLDKLKVVNQKIADLKK